MKSTNIRLGAHALVVCLAAHGSAALQATLGGATPGWNTPVPDRLIDTVSISVSSAIDRATPMPLQAQTLPVESCSSWPIWVLKGKESTSHVRVFRVPAPAAADVWTSGTSFVPPASFEQLWLPANLPVPHARMAIGLVLRNGKPQYIFPTLDTYLDVGERRYHNRGLCSVPLAKTWLHYGESPAENLRLSCSVVSPAPAGAHPTAASPWVPCLEPLMVVAALDATLAALKNLPEDESGARLPGYTSLERGFCYLIAPLEDESATLPEAAMQPGGKLRVLLSDVKDWGVVGSDAREMAGPYGECELSLHAVLCAVPPAGPPGRESLSMREPYRELYEHKR